MPEYKREDCPLGDGVPRRAELVARLARAVWNDWSERGRLEYSARVMEPLQFDGGTDAIRTRLVLFGVEETQEWVSLPELVAIFRMLQGMRDQAPFTKHHKKSTTKHRVDLDPSDSETLAVLKQIHFTTDPTIRGESE